MPNTVPASRMLLIALQQASLLYQQERQNILNAAAEENLALNGATLDQARGVWVLPDLPAP